ncbi:MAG TPA: iron-sulfur cluster assembly protein [Candidatus Xenobia bacterium]
MATEAELREALQDIYDPEIPVNIVDLGLIYGIEQDGGKVTVTMTLTTPGCGMAGMIGQEIKERLLMIPKIDSVDVKIVWEPPWSPDLISAEAKEVLGI